MALISLCNDDEETFGRYFDHTTDIGDVLIMAASCGIESHCVMAREAGATNIADMLIAATKYGHREICNLAYTWSQEMGVPLDYNNMLRTACHKVSNFDLCITACQWMLLSRTPMDFRGVRVYGERHGRADLLELAREWEMREREASRTDYDPDDEVMHEILTLCHIDDGRNRSRAIPVCSHHAIDLLM